MAEETVWRGTSSQWKNFGVYILCALFCWLIVPIFIALARYLQTKNKVYELTTERLKITEGVFSKVTDTLELYRVKDLETRQPFLYRTFGVENVQLNTSDASSPFIFIDAIPCTIGLGDKFGTRWKRFVPEKACARSTSNNRSHACIVGGANLSIATSIGSRGRVVFPTIP
ncbi:MAG TPA: PH domain-containing protein [Candidatus Udaeobacter sp.]|jgi:hypothetical protein